MNETNEAPLLRTWEFYPEGQETKRLTFLQGDLCLEQAACDIAVCSAFRGDYLKIPGSLIDDLYRERGIDVEALSRDPELDLRTMGCWLSRETGREYRRIACVELIDYADHEEQLKQAEIILQKGFSTLRYLIEQASIAALPVETIAMPLLGSGHQMIEPAYILGPMLTQCRRLLEECSVKHVLIYERDPAKAEQLLPSIERALRPASRPPEVFVSYSTKQAEEANRLAEFLVRRGISCWMAPLSIPAGSSYLDEIPAAISGMKTMLLLLTEDAENSRWVQKEVSSAIGANKTVLPYMPRPYTLGTKFSFLLDGEQILPAYLEGAHALDALYARILAMTGITGE